METLIEKLYHNNVIFSYYGFIDKGVLGEVLKITRSKLESLGESPAFVKKVEAATSDCVENIIRHNFYPDDERMHYKSLLVISRQKEYYVVDTLNVVNDSQKSVIDTQLGFLSGKKNNAGLPAEKIRELFEKADSYDCAFKKVKDHYLFNISFKISTLPSSVPV
jgi:hypothetical protein